MNVNTTLRRLIGYCSRGRDSDAAATHVPEERGLGCPVWSVGARYAPVMPSADATISCQVQSRAVWTKWQTISLTRLREVAVTDAPPGSGGGPTVRRMLVGAQLRRLRTEQGISHEQAGEAIRASEWKIHRLENGQVGFKERDVVDLLRLYGVTDPDEVAALVELAHHANQPGWWQPYGDLLPQWFRAYIDLESAAMLIRTYEGQFVPGLLQTTRYMRAVIGGAYLGAAPEELELRDVVYLEHLTNAVYLDKREDLDQYLHVMESISVRSQPPDKTAELLAKIVKEEAR